MMEPDPMTSARRIPTICAGCAHAEDRSGHYLHCTWQHPGALPDWLRRHHGSAGEEHLRLRTRDQPAYQEVWQCETYQPKAQEE